MAKNDIQIYDEAAFGYPGDEQYGVTLGVLTSIKAGEPVSKALGATAVAAMATNKPVVATDFLAGIATQDSTDTVTANGIVRVTKVVPGRSFLIVPKVVATFNTQLKYDDLVGARVLIDLTAGVYTILAADSATSGCVIMPLDISKFPGKVRFAFRRGVNYLS
jgi:hypothetical protein